MIRCCALVYNLPRGRSCVLYGFPSSKTISSGRASIRYGTGISSLVHAQAVNDEKPLRMIQREGLPEGPTILRLGTSARFLPTLMEADHAPRSTGRICVWFHRFLRFSPNLLLPPL
jgi:hypothetical protein